MSRKRVQLSDLDLKNNCQLAVEHQHLSQDKLKGPTVFLADNAQFSAQDRMLLQTLATKVLKMLVSRISQSHQQNITAFFSSYWVISCAWFVDKPAVQVNALNRQQSKIGVRVKFDWTFDDLWPSFYTVTNLKVICRCIALTTKRYSDQIVADQCGRCKELLLYVQAASAAVRLPLH